jgi:hypothetical protein
MIEDGDCEGCVEKIVSARVKSITSERDRLRELLMEAQSTLSIEDEDLYMAIDAELARDK